MNHDNLPNNVYYDANIINNDTTGTKQPPQLVFQDIRSTPILSHPELYELSVVRFNLQTANSLPLWIPSIQLNQQNFDRNLTSYSFHLVYNLEGKQYESDEVFVKYIPSDFSASIPTKARSIEDMHIPYYYVKSFNIIVEMFNVALEEAMQQLHDRVDNYNVTLPSPNAPFFEFDSESSKFILNADVLGFDSNEEDHISIYCNSPLYTLLSGFQGDYYGINATQGRNYCFKIKKEMRSLNLFTVNDSFSVIQLYQEYSSASLFTPISSIVFTSNMIPVLPTNSTKPTIFNGEGALTNSGNNNNITSMITDFHSSSDNAYPFSGSLSYLPSSEYRCISLNRGNEKITNIDLSVFWRSQYGSLYPLLLMPQCKCDIKILFRKIKNL